MDREQVRRDDRTRKIVHVLCNCECRHAQTGHEAMRELDALLAELEQAERERDEAQERERVTEAHLANALADAEELYRGAAERIAEMDAWIESAEAQLAKVPALVEAIHEVTVGLDPESWESERLTQAVVVFEQAQGEKP